jgi:hypothetical protein
MIKFLYQKTQQKVPGTYLTLRYKSMSFNVSLDALRKKETIF